MSIRHLDSRLLTLLPLLALAMSGPVMAGDEQAAMPAEMMHHHHEAGATAEAATDPHAQHHMAMQQTSVEVEHHAYAIPALKLLDSDGRSVDLAALLASERPIAVNFIFTSCTTICPVMTATLRQLQRRVAGQLDNPLFVSITIDPDYDTALVMQKYAERFGAEWTFLTGDHDVVMAALKTFDAWRGNKMNHEALTLLRMPGQSDWTRVVGLASADQLATIWSNGST
jgi:protein SCO1/2